MTSFILWIPYIISQLFLAGIIVYLGITTNILKDNMFLIGFLIATYGFLLILSSDIRRYFKNKTKLENNK